MEELSERYTAQGNFVRELARRRKILKIHGYWYESLVETDIMQTLSLNLSHIFAAIMNNDIYKHWKLGDFNHITMLCCMHSVWGNQIKCKSFFLLNNHTLFFIVSIKLNILNKLGASKLHYQSICHPKKCKNTCEFIVFSSTILNMVFSSVHTPPPAAIFNVSTGSSNQKSL